MKRSAWRSCVAAAILALAASPVAAIEYFVPVVAQTPGAEGSYWNTELWIANLAASPGTYAFAFLPAGKDNSQLLTAPLDTVRVPPGATLRIDDVVPPDSSGALRVVASDGIEIRCRLFNMKANGSAGQLVPVLRRDALVRAGDSAHLLPLLRSPQYRTNIGLFNPNTRLLEVRAVLYDEAGGTVGHRTYRLEPGSQKQLNDFLLGFKVQRTNGHRVVLVADGAFAAYGSVVDSRSGAGTFITPVVY